MYVAAGRLTPVGSLRLAVSQQQIDELEAVVCGSLMFWPLTRAAGVVVSCQYCARSGDDVYAVQLNVG